MKISEGLLRARTTFGFTQKQVSEGSGVTVSGIQKYEYGERVPNASALISLADFYDCSLDYLVGRSDDPKRQ